MADEHKQVWKKNACPECGSRHCWLKGWQPARGGPKRRLMCADCGRSYSPKDKKDIFIRL